MSYMLTPAAMLAVFLNCTLSIVLLESGVPFLISLLIVLVTGTIGGRLAAKYDLSKMEKKK